MSLLRHFRRSHIQGGRLGSQSWSGHQGGWQCIPDDKDDADDDDGNDNDIDDGDDYDVDDDDDCTAIVGQVIRGLAMHTFKLASSDQDFDQRVIQSCFFLALQKEWQNR